MFAQVHEFASLGSNDENIIEVHGNEILHLLKIGKMNFALIISFVTIILSGLGNPLMSLGFAVFVDSLAPSDSEMITDPSSMNQKMHDGVVTVAARLGYLMIGVLSIHFIQCILRLAFLSPRYYTVLKRELLRAIMKQNASFFDSNATGVLISRMSEDVTLVVETFFGKFYDVVSHCCRICSIIVISFTRSWKCALIVVCIAPLYFFIKVVSDHIIHKNWTQYQDTSSDASASSQEILTSFRTVKSFDCEQEESEKYRRQLFLGDEQLRRTSQLSAIQDGVRSFFSFGWIALIVSYSGYLFLENELKIGTIVMLLIASLVMFTSCQVVFTTMIEFDNAKISAAKLISIFDHLPQIDENGGDSPQTQMSGEIEFRDVKFKYQNTERYAIDGLSFLIHPGETVAFVGESGCGKTTTLSLLQRFYEIESGEILIDGIDIRTLSPRYLRSQIAVVPQGPVLFSMSIQENIGFGRDESTIEEITAAARIGNAHDFIMEIDQNYSQTVQNSSLSGGQKQRICISRAILAGKPILLLDEATAALDTESERLVQLSLDQYRNGKTAIVVAHRLSTVQNANRIFVFKEGRIAEIGTHQELLMNGGLYTDLVKNQLQ